MSRLLKRGNSASVFAGDAPALPGDTVFAQAHEAAAVSVSPAWQAGQAYAVDDVVAYDGRLWRVVQSHTSQAGWLPGVAWALFAETWESGTVPAWRQPQGAHDAYPSGFRVTHEGQTWQSNVDANVWEPGVFGWDVVDG